MDSPNGLTTEVNLTNKLDPSDRDQFHIPVKLVQDPDPKSKIVVESIETSNGEISDDRSSSTTPTGSRSKKSVRWSQDLVEERTLPPLEKSDDGYGSSNSYANRYRDSSDSPAFNINS